MFQKNLEVLKKKNPNLASKLEKIKLEDVKGVAVFEAESKDLIISYNETALHNTEDPAREAKTVWNRFISRELKKNDIQIVYGMGLGYLFKRAYVNANSKLFVVEPYIDVLRFVLEYVDFSEELNQDRVFISDNNEDILSKLQAEYLSGDRVEFLFLNSYAALCSSKLVELTNKAVEICESKGVDQNTIFIQCKHWTENSILNMPNFTDAMPAGFFERSFAKKPALILSAGPSLADNIDKIKENKDKFVTIAVAPVFRTLVNAGIIPDFVAFADPMHLNKYVEGLEDVLEDTNMLIGSRAENSIFNKSAKSKIIYFSDIDPLSGWMNEAANVNLGLYKSGGTVSILSYYFAKALGCDPIAFVGLDLAFINNKVYADGTDLQVDDANNIHLDHNFAVPKKLIYVKSNNGEMIPTRDDYAIFIRHFEEIFTQEFNFSRIINTSVNGALINGMEYMEFDEFLKIVSNQKIEVSGIISEIFTKNVDKWVNANISLNQQLKSQKEFISQLASTAQSLNIKLLEICNLLENENTNYSEVESRLEAIKDLINSTRNEVIRNSFISNYLHREIWQYTKDYNTSILPNRLEFKDNMNLEAEFFNTVYHAASIICRWMDESLKLYDSKLPAVKS